MNDDVDYRPPSDFLERLVQEDLSLSKGPGADARAAQVIALTQDADPANRDWALLLLAQSDLDNEAAREALAKGMDDPHHEASLEALIGVAIREPKRALPRVAALLAEEAIDSMTLEAAAYVADRSLLPALEAIRAETQDDGDMWERTLEEAIAACRRGSAPEVI